MRLWHEALIQKLPRQQLLGQHRECAALRGNGWGRKHATVNYVFQHSPYKLFQFHMLVMDEMERRGYHPDQNWRQPEYRGKTCPAYQELTSCSLTKPIYPEHDDAYLQLCERLLAERTKKV
ncbi:TIGR02328 family protein [Fructilactobacillus carniphilus]|uniref:TIGR02328 family protein n=1 Tax=Fructilactobacillus carniphilus TaxID=2940297 RepID=A0ABY5BXD5_9LACO|nr:TIGR02328 family protein [Fructilactobacillus carniphilus]USS90464.1 TIGR02328 family protein [Fructilactobacillus carniphilus]